MAHGRARSRECMQIRLAWKAFSSEPFQKARKRLPFDTYTWFWNPMPHGGQARAGRSSTQAPGRAVYTVGRAAGSMSVAVH